MRELTLAIPGYLGQQTPDRPGGARWQRVRFGTDGSEGGEMIGPRVLVVDDDPLGRELVTELLEKEGCQVLTAASAEIGLRLAAAERPALILMDLRLPGITGEEAIRKLKADAATAGVPVVAVTAAAMLGNDEEARDAGCDAYLTKPFDVKVFRDTLRRFLPAGTGSPDPSG
jgi:two-component system cell cycle response regulator DivK